MSGRTPFLDGQPIRNMSPRRGQVFNQTGPASEAIRGGPCTTSAAKLRSSPARPTTSACGWSRRPPARGWYRRNCRGTRLGLYADSQRFTRTSIVQCTTLVPRPFRFGAEKLTGKHSKKLIVRRTSFPPFPSIWIVKSLRHSSPRLFRHSLIHCFMASDCFLPPLNTAVNSVASGSSGKSSLLKPARGRTVPSELISETPMTVACASMSREWEASAVPTCIKTATAANVTSPEMKAADIPKRLFNNIPLGILASRCPESIHGAPRLTTNHYSTGGWRAVSKNR